MSSGRPSSASSTASRVIGQVVAELGALVQPSPQRHRVVVDLAGFLTERVERHAGH
jgi:hypothetical protein